MSLKLSNLSIRLYCSMPGAEQTSLSYTACPESVSWFLHPKQDPPLIPRFPVHASRATVILPLHPEVPDAPPYLHFKASPPPPRSATSSRKPVLIATCTPQSMESPRAHQSQNSSVFCFFFLHISIFALHHHFYEHFFFDTSVSLRRHLVSDSPLYLL